MVKEFILTLIKTVQSLREEVYNLNSIIDKQQLEIDNLKKELSNQSNNCNK